MALKVIEVLILLTLSLISDIRTYKVKNMITLTLALLGIATNCFLKGMDGFKLSSLGMFVPIALLFILFVLRMMGAGDIKLFGAIGAIMGYRFTLFSIIYSFILGGLIGLCLLLLRKNMRERLRYLAAYLKSCLLSLRLLEYEDFSDRGGKGKFRFTYAIVPGTLIELFMVLTF